MIFPRRPSRSSRRRPRPLCGFAVLTIAILCGCEASDAPSETSAGATPAPVESSVNRGPIRFTVRADRGEITVGQKLALTVEVVCPREIDIEMPQVTDELGDFAVRQADTPPDVPEDDQRRWTHVYVLDTFASGEVEIPSLTVGFVDHRPEILDQNGRAVTGDLPSDPLPITVHSVLVGDEADTDFRDIRGAVDVPVRRDLGDVLIIAAIVGGGLLILALVLSLLIYLGRRRAGDLPQRVIPPHVWALGELKRLAEDRLIERERFHEFYFRLSDIVRQYIERRFAIMAPERTTEEFLREAKRNSALAEEHKELLASFLRAADMVKFARHRPTSDESHAAFDAARGFVEQTVPAGEGEPDAVPTGPDRSEAAA